MYLLSRSTYHLIHYAVLACVHLHLYPSAADMRRDDDDRPMGVGASFTFEQETLGIMLLELVQKLLRDRPNNLNDVLNHVFQTLMSDDSLALTYWFTNRWALVGMLVVYWTTLVLSTTFRPISFNITVLEGSLDTILGDSSKTAHFVTRPSPCARKKDDFQRNDDSNITVLAGSLDDIIVDSLEDTDGDLFDTGEPSPETGQVVVSCLVVARPCWAQDNFQSEADCYAERKKHNFKDLSLEKTRQDSIHLKKTLKHVEDPEIARKKKVAIIQEKLRKESRDPFGLNETELEVLRTNLKNRK